MADKIDTTALERLRGAPVGVLRRIYWQAMRTPDKPEDRAFNLAVAVELDRRQHGED